MTYPTDANRATHLIYPVFVSHDSQDFADLLDLCFTHDSLCSANIYGLRHAQRSSRSSPNYLVPVLTNCAAFSTGIMQIFRCGITNVFGVEFSRQKPIFSHIRLLQHKVERHTAHSHISHCATRGESAHFSVQYHPQNRVTRPCTNQGYKVQNEATPEPVVFYQ